MEIKVLLLSVSGESRPSVVAVSGGIAHPPSVLVSRAPATRKTVQGHHRMTVQTRSTPAPSYRLIGLKKSSACPTTYQSLSYVPVVSTTPAAGLGVCQCRKSSLSTARDKHSDIECSPR